MFQHSKPAFFPGERDMDYMSSRVHRTFHSHQAGSDWHGAVHPDGKRQSRNRYWDTTAPPATPAGAGAAVGAGIGNARQGGRGNLVPMPLRAMSVNPGNPAPVLAIPALVFYSGGESAKLDCLRSALTIFLKWELDSHEFLSNVRGIKWPYLISLKNKRITHQT